jgi:hypothetical protein
MRKMASNSIIFLISLFLSLSFRAWSSSSVDIDKRAVEATVLNRLRAARRVPSAADRVVVVLVQAVQPGLHGGQRAWLARRQILMLRRVLPPRARKKKEKKKEKGKNKNKTHHANIKEVRRNETREQKEKEGKDKAGNNEKRKRNKKKERNESEEEKGKNVWKKERKKQQT